MTRLLLIPLFWLTLPGLTSAQDAALRLESLQVLTRHDPQWTTVQPEYFSFSPNGEFFTAASESNTAAIWSVQTGEILLTLTGHAAPIRVTAWSPDGQWIATSATDETTIHIWRRVE